MGGAELVLIVVVIGWGEVSGDSGCNGWEWGEIDDGRLGGCN